ncbi:arylamine N-acetyltransferase [Escherichia coli]
MFERVLRELGFNVRSLLGRVVLSNPPALPPRTHRFAVGGTGRGKMDC